MRACRIILMLALMVSASACSCRRFVTQSTTQESTATEKTIEYIERLKDTVIYVAIPQESREVTVKRDSSKLETSLAESVARIEDDGSLFHSLANKQGADTVTITVVERETVVIENKETGSHTVVEVPVRLPLRKWEKFLCLCGTITLIFFAVKAAAYLAKVLRR